jgi:hypothetical protein
MELQPDGLVISDRTPAPISKYVTPTPAPAVGDTAAAAAAVVNAAIGVVCRPCAVASSPPFLPPFAARRLRPQALEPPGLKFQAVSVRGVRGMVLCLVTQREYHMLIQPLGCDPAPAPKARGNQPPVRTGAQNRLTGVGCGCVRQRRGLQIGKTSTQYLLQAMVQNWNV